MRQCLPLTHTSFVLIQKQIVRLITFSKHFAHTKSIIIQIIKYYSSQQSLLLQNLTLMYKLSNGLLSEVHMECNINVNNIDINISFTHFNGVLKLYLHNNEVILIYTK